jgi:hypothetical protein
VPKGTKHLFNIPYSQGEKKIYLMQWEYDGHTGRNHYLAGNPPFSLQQYREILLNAYNYAGGSI